MKHHLSHSCLAMAMLAMLIGVATDSEAITRNALASYASSLQGKKKAELKTAVYNLCKPSKVLGYGSGSGKTWSGFVKTDRVGTTLECRNRYSADRFYFSSATQNSAISGMNIEHSFPKSWWGGTENNAYKDLYNLYPSESSANSKKSNYVMDKVSNASVLDDYERVGTGANASSYASSASKFAVEPHDNWKGDFCRGYFYMVTVYQNFTWESSGLSCLENDTWPTLQQWAQTLYLSWAHTDLVDDIEVDRNNAVYAIQGNRNLFVDYPYLADYIWGDSMDVAFNPYTSISTAEDDGRYAGGDTPVTPSVAAPTFSPAGGTYTTAQTVSISTTTSGATIYYTTDGTTPTTSSSQYASALSISATTTVKAIAVKDGEASAVSTATYTISSSSTGDDGSGDTYVKVTSNSQLQAGKKYLIVYEAGGKALSAKAGGNYRTDADVTINGNTISTETNVSGKPSELTLGGTSGAWTLYDATASTYLGLTSDGNYLYNVASGTNGYSWTIDVTADNIIQNNRYTARYIQYNVSSPRFACYKGTQKAVALYVKQAGSATTTPTLTVSPASLSFSAEAGGTATQTFTVKGANLTGNVAATLSGASVYSLSETTVSAADAAAGKMITVTFAPQAAGSFSGTVTLSSEGAESKTVSLSGTATAKAQSYRYVKTNTIESGKHYLIVADNNGALEAASPLSSSKSYGYLDKYDVTASNNVITLTSQDHEFLFTESGSGYTIQQHDGRYLYQTGNYNSFNVSATAPTSGGVWTAEGQSDGTFKIANTGVGKYIQYSTRYSSYGSYSSATGIMPSLYVLESEVESPVRYKASATDDWHSLEPDENGAYNIADREFYAFEVTRDVENATVNYTRSFSNGIWAAWTLPIDVNVDANLLSKYRFGYFEGVSNEGSGISKENLAGVTISVKMLTPGQTVGANLPYVVLPQTSGSNTFTITGTLKKTEPQSTQIVGNAYNYITEGVYAQKNYDNDLWYAITANGALQRAGSGSYLHPFRFFMTVTDKEGVPYLEAPETINIVFDDETTGVSAVKAADKAGEQNIYDLQGRRVDKPVQKGVYIVNGRKVVL